MVFAKDIKKEKKRITLNDIAKLCGVSKTTASIILNGRGDLFRIKEETCLRVKQVAKQYNYRANIHAKALQSQRNNVIGLVIPDLTNYGFAYTTKTLEKLCREAGLNLLITCSDDNPAQEKLAIDSLLDRQIDLLVIAPTHQDPRYYDSILKHTPIIQLDRHIPSLAINYVISDDCVMVTELVERIVKTYQLSEYFYFGGQLCLSPSKSRLNGFLQGLHNAGITENAEWILHRDYQPESGYQMLKETVLRLGRLPEAIFTASYTILEGVLRYLTEHQQMDQLLTQQLHIATFDDHDILNCLPFRIHSIEQNHKMIAQQLFQQIKQCLSHKELNNIKVACQLHWRDQ